MTRKVKPADRRKRGWWEKTYSHEARAKKCADHGVRNTGRQWRKLRKRLGLAVRIWRASQWVAL